MRLVLDARTAAFASLIDYAGVFPPASLPMPEAVAEYRGLRSSDDRWVVGRFLCRASQLEHLAAVATSGMARGEPPWRVGVIMDVSPGAAASLAHEFQREMAPFMEIDAAEARIGSAASAGELLDAISAIDQGVAAFVEITTSGEIRPQIDDIAEGIRERGMVGGAKLRCGGTDAAAFPSPAVVTEFIWQASLAGVPFKATAGLHQPVRHHDDDLGVDRHGFVNLLMASVATDQGEERGTVERIVSETDPSAFAIRAATLSWHDIAYPGSAIRRSRTTGFLAFGSCDADEPIAALRSRSMLGEGT